jgi:hypothetical protein
LWLLDAKTFKLEAFFDEGIPEYAHRWGEEEVTLQDMVGIDISVSEAISKIEYAFELSFLS